MGFFALISVFMEFKRGMNPKSRNGFKKGHKINLGKSRGHWKGKKLSLETKRKIKNLLKEVRFLAVQKKIKEARSKIDKTKLLYYGDFERFEKLLDNNFIVSIDILFNEVSDRQTGIAFSADWVFGNSEIKTIQGKTITEELKLRVANPDALVVMKISSCRINDIRDVFMLAPNIKNKNWIKKEISKKYNFNERFSRIKEKITSKQFKDSLQGVYGIIDDKVFDKHKKAVLGLENPENTKP